MTRQASAGTLTRRRERGPRADGGGRPGAARRHGGRQMPAGWLESPPMAGPVYRFGPFALDAGAFRLRREEREVPLSPQLLDVLLYLVRQGAALTSKEQL